MAEFDPPSPPDATEAAYRQALLDDAAAGSERRRARLMAALPQPAPAAVPVSRAALAWRWQPYAWSLLAMGLLVVAVVALRGTATGSKPSAGADRRVASAQPTPPAQGGSATVLAQAGPAAETPAAPAVAPARQVAKTVRQKPRATQPAPVVVADADLGRRGRQESEAFPAVAGDTASDAPRFAAAAPATASVPAVAPAAPIAPAAAPKVLAESSAPATAAGRLAHSLAASDAAEPQPLAVANARLLSAVTQADPGAVRSALQAGASVHQHGAQGRTPLMLAARSGSREVVDLLLAAGARKTDHDARGWTAAEHAQDQGYMDLVDRLR